MIANDCLDGRGLLKSAVSLERSKLTCTCIRDSGIDFLMKKFLAIDHSGTLNHDSYVEYNKYLGKAYFPVSVGAGK